MKKAQTLTILSILLTTVTTNAFVDKVDTLHFVKTPINTRTERKNNVTLVQTINQELYKMGRNKQIMDHTVATKEMATRIPIASTAQTSLFIYKWDNA